MKIFIPKETHPEESRIPMIPQNAGKLVKKGAEVYIERGLGAGIHFSDDQYTQVGVKIVEDRKKMLAEADMVLRLRKPPKDEISLMKKGCIHISYMDPFFEQDLVETMAKHHISCISMEMIPRTTIAQKMDALSSQASLGGYVAVLLAAERLAKIFPMMMTPAGTIAPSKVFIVGAGVAGLQAIATAKRLGARVEAFDTRPVVKTEVQSLGAKFVEIDLGETGQTKDGYAKALTPEQLQKQREGMAKICASADVVITTAQVFGRKAPLIITQEMIDGMKPGSVIVDMAAETGGNVAGTKLGEEIITPNGVRIIGLPNLPGRVPVHASQMYSSNLVNMIEHFWNDEQKAFELKFGDEIIDGCVITHEGEIKNEMLKNHYAKGGQS
ncbi:MAG: Re/Si-specific NAD(P)(+) transhydrogenase subunit alpha [Gemmatimonadetes bacterium]|nr:MAG: Re/Si-specific NAD(P)(+) transhydrogenase subunit alpha [Gemmatimonadota bacterium]